MTTDEARVIAAEFQDRADQMGNRTGEGIRLGHAATVIRNLAAQIDDLTPATEPVEFVASFESGSEQTHVFDPATAKRRGRPPKVRENAE